MTILTFVHFHSRCSTGTFVVSLWSSRLTVLHFIRAPSTRLARWLIHPCHHVLLEISSQTLQKTQIGWKQTNVGWCTVQTTLRMIHGERFPRQRSSDLAEEFHILPGLDSGNGGINARLEGSLQLVVVVVRRRREGHDFLVASPTNERPCERPSQKGNFLWIDYSCDCFSKQRERYYLKAFRCLGNQADQSARRQVLDPSQNQHLIIMNVSEKEVGGSFGEYHPLGSRQKKSSSSSSSFQSFFLTYSERFVSWEVPIFEI